MNGFEPTLKTQIRHFFQSAWAPFLVVGVIVLLLIAGRLCLEPWIQARNRPVFTGPSLESIQQIVSDVLTAQEVKSQILPPRGRHAARWRVNVPQDLPKTDLYVSLQKSLLDIGVRVLQARADPASGRVDLELGWADSCLLLLELNPADYRRNAGRIAILIDDFGDRNDVFARSFFDLDGDITVSVIPGLAHSRDIAEAAAERGCEVVIHLPMEPLEGRYPSNGYTLITEMSEEQVMKVLDAAIRQLPEAAGLNNHMGSKVTADRRMMGYLMAAMKDKHLYFIDSRTTAASVAYAAAVSAGLRCAERDVFLDNDADSKATIRKAFADLAARAAEHGTAVGIGHCHRNTLEVLREDMPGLQERGFRFVRLSQAVL